MKNIKADLTEYGKNVRKSYIEYSEDSGGKQVDNINIVSLSKNEYERFLKKIGGNYESYKDGAILIDGSINYIDGKRQQGNMYKWQKGDTITGKIDGKNYEIKIVARTEENQKVY